MGDPGKIAEISSRWSTLRCPGHCQCEGPVDDEVEIEDVRLEVRACTNPACRVIHYYGPRTEKPI